MTLRAIPTVREPAFPLRVIQRWIQWITAFCARPFYALYEGHLAQGARAWSVPKHIGIILDGNRRYARSEGLDSVADGHERGADKLEEVLEWCEERGVEVVTVWAFSLDNFAREAGEVERLMDLFERRFLALVTEPRIMRNQIRVRFVGRTDLLPERVRRAIEEVESATRHHARRVLNIGVAYAGRQEIVDAFRRLLEDEARRGRSLTDVANKLDDTSITRYLYTSDLPDPDLIIRTSGEVRLSGFLLWQSAYSEYYFCDTHWPAFRRIDFLRALRDYDRRQRRFGK